MLFYEFIGEFNIILDSLDNFEIILWVIVCILFAYIGLKFIQESKETKMFIFVGLFFMLTIGARVVRMISKFIVGHEYGDNTFEGIQLPLSFFYLMFSYLGSLFYYIFLERDILKKTHHFFSIMVIVVMFLTILNYFFEMFFWLTITFLIVILGVPGCYFYIAVISSGDTRKHALMMMAGLLLVIFGLSLDNPTPASLYKQIPFMPEFAQFGAPSLQILGAFLFRYAFLLQKR
jgi:hypothetical protein